MKKVLVINSSLEKSGLTKIIYYIAKYKKSSKYEFRILTLSPEPTSSDWEAFKDLGIELDSICIEERTNIFKLGKLLRKKVALYKPDLIHTHSLRGTLFTSLFLRRYKHFATLHSNVFDNYIDEFGIMKGVIYSLLEYFGFFLANYASVVSESIYNKIWFKRQVKIIRNGVDLDQFLLPSFEEKYQVRSTLSLPKDKIVIVSLGSLIPRKNPDFILDCFLNSKNNSNKLLLVIGNGPLEFQLKEKAKNNSNVIFIGKVNDPANYLICADYIISSSISEGLPNSIIEGISCGLFPLLSSIESHQELIKISNSPHLFFSLRSAEELIEIFETLKLISPVKNLYDFSAKNMVKQYEEVYHLALQI